MSPVDRRQHERVPLRGEVVVAHNGRRERMDAHDGSMGGAFLRTTLWDHIEHKTGARCEITLHVDEDMPVHASEDGHTIHVRARIVRRDPGGPGRPSGLGVAFEKVDASTLVKLRALVTRGS